jgi:hypothetical protein
MLQMENCSDGFNVPREHTAKLYIVLNNLCMIALKITLTYQLPNYCRKNENTKTCLDVGTV